jgi:hypothetical protein
MVAQKVKNLPLERQNTMPKSSNEEQSLILVDKIFGNRSLSMHAKLVGLFLIGCYCNRQAWPSLNTIALRCKIGKFTALKAFRALKSQGLLEDLGYRLDSEVINNA